MAQSYTRGDEPVPGYRLLKFLGRGAFGEVWKASGPGGTECALKIINLVDKQGFKEFRAIRLVKRIHHPNLVPIIGFWLKDEQGNILDDAGETDSVWLKGKEAELFIAMGLGDKNLGDRLKECLDQGKPGIPTEELLDYMEEAAKAIDFLNQPRHDLGSGPVSIQHCDIKPQNVLIVGGSAQVCDFGLARQLNDVRKTSTAAGTYAYIAPESIENQPSKSNDQYSLAISYVELRTGFLPFNVNSLYEVMFVHLQGKLDFSKLPEPEQTVLKRATALNPNDRFPTSSEMVKALRRAIEGKPTSKPDVSFSGPPRGLLQPDMEIVPGYKLVRFIGRGGYGEVWEAKAPGGKLVALKIIRSLEAAGGRQEFKALELIKAVDHNHLMELHAYWLLDANGQIIPDEVRKRPDAPAASILVIATKLAKKNLLERLDECRQPQGGEGGIPLPELLVYMRQAADAIDYLNAPHHTLGDRQVSILHRDIKPENILLSANTVKVTDFGLAKVVEGTSAVIHGDSAGLTLSYAAPEVFANKVTSWSDQYSLAVTYFHLRTGRLPFKATAPTEIFVIHVEGRLDLTALPEPERTVIARATCKDPENRFPTCMDMVRALEEACGISPSALIAVGLAHGSNPSLPGKRVSDTDPTIAPPGAKPPSSLPGTDRPKGKTSPNPPSSPAPSGSPAPSQGGVKPEYNPYLTLTSTPPAGLLPLAEPRNDTDPVRSQARDTDRPLERNLPGSEPTIEYRSGPPPVPAPAEVKVTPRHGWKKTAEARLSEPSGKSSVRWLKVVVVVAVIGVLLGGAIVAGRHIIGGSDATMPTDGIAALIRQGKFHEASDKIEASKSSLTGPQVEELHAQNAKEWFQLADRLYAEKDPSAANNELEEMLRCYGQDSNALKLKTEVTEKLSRLDQLGQRCQKELRQDQWEKAWDTAQEIKRDYREAEDLVVSLTRQAREQGQKLGEKRLKEAVAASDAKEANRLFAGAWGIGEKLKQHGSSAGPELMADVGDQWERYGRKLALSDPNEATALADEFQKVTQDAKAARLKEFIKASAKSNKARKLLSQFTEALGQRDSAAALNALRQIGEEIDHLPADTKASLSRSLEDRFDELVSMLGDKATQAETVAPFVAELRKFSISASDQALLEGLAALRAGEFARFGEQFDQAEKAGVSAHDRSAAMSQALKWYLNEVKDATGLGQVLNRAERCLDDPSSLEGARIRENYCKLVTRLVRSRLPELSRPADIEDVLRYARSAQRANKPLGALTPAFLAECLLVQRKEGSVGALANGAAPEAARLVDFEADSAPDTEYVEYVRGLLRQAEKQPDAAVRHFDRAFKKPSPKLLEDKTRRAIASEAYFDAGKKGLEKHEFQTAYELLKKANELQVASRVDYQLALFESAAELEPEQFGDATHSVLSGRSLASWNAGNLVRLADLFLQWAERPKNRSYAPNLVNDFRLALASALDKRVADPIVNFWMGVVCWQNRQDAADKQKAYACFGKVLVRSEKPTDEAERRVYDAIGPNPRDRLAALNAALPPAREKLTAMHTQLLLKRLVLIMENDRVIEEDFKLDFPTFLADANDVARLERHLAYKAQAHVAAWKALNKGLNPEKKLIPPNKAQEFNTYRDDHLAKLEQLLLEDATYEWDGALGWARYCHALAKDKDPEKAKQLQKMIDAHSSPAPQGEFKQGREKLKSAYV